MLFKKWSIIRSLAVITILLSLIVCLPEKSLAQSGVSCEPENIKPIFCEGLLDEAIYDKYRFSSYKMLTPGNEGWIFRSGSDLKQDFTLLPGTMDNLVRLNQLLKQSGSHLVLLYTPTRGMMHSSKLPSETIEKSGYDVNSAWQSYNESVASMQQSGIDVVGFPKPKNDFTDFFYKRDHHWNASGSKQAAELLAVHLKQLDLYEAIPKVGFQTKQTSDIYYYGASKKVFKKVCQTEQPPEVIPTYLTERSSSVTDANDLFGDAPEPEIILNGTSNSTAEPSMANFEGFLKEAAQADVLNMSVSGGGMDTAMLDYLNSDFYRTRPAKVIIWELPSYYDLNKQSRFFREAIPATSAICPNPVIGTEKLEIKDAQFIALDNLQAFKARGTDYHIRLKFSKPMTGPFVMDLRYLKNRERYRFPKPVQTESESIFNLQLRADKKQHLQKIVLEVPDDMVGENLDVMLCKNP